MAFAIQSDTEWAASKVDSLPARWQRSILGRWSKQRSQHAPDDWMGEVEAGRVANIALRSVVDSLETVRLPLDATDFDVVQHAQEQAQRCAQIGSATIAGQMPGPWALGLVTQRIEERALHQTPAEQRAAMARLCIAQGIEPPADNVQDGPSIKRMTDAQWWRRKLRRMHGRAVEGAAIALGGVNKSRDCYVSNESVYRRAQQNARNAATLEDTLVVNEYGQEYTLAELAATGPGNKAIRRAELMTRIAGFERIAIDLGHVGLFFTVTCPSRMHKWSTRKGGGVIENRHYDGTLPIDAQKYLAQLWGRVRAALQRRGVKPYGFRIAEPNHDGTPHWHILVFLPAAHVVELTETVWNYALSDSGRERGANLHRCDFKHIDAGRGTAAGYIAKYVAKNIDGFALEKDLFGNEAITASQRVETWATTWGIRQFQQIGGAPVGPWRELRRVESVPDKAPAHLVEAHQAVNRIKTLIEKDGQDLEHEEVKAAQWDRYTKAQGGIFCGRKYLIKVEHITAPEGDTSSKYGEPHAPKPIGVTTTSREIWFPEWMAHMSPRGRAERLVVWLVESVRHAWTIVRGGGVKKAPLAGPWTSVNNCTDPQKPGEHFAEKTAPPGAIWTPKHQEEATPWPTKQPRPTASPQKSGNWHQKSDMTPQHAAQ